MRESRICIRTHSLLVKRRRLPQIAYVDSYLILQRTIFYAEIVPSRMSSGVRVNSKKKVELSWSLLDHTVEIAALEGSVKDIVWNVRKRWVDALEGSIKKSGLILGF
jgi:hypothetical protein